MKPNRSKWGSFSKELGLARVNNDQVKVAAPVAMGRIRLKFDGTISYGENARQSKSPCRNRDHAKFFKLRN